MALACVSGWTEGPLSDAGGRELFAGNELVGGIRVGYWRLAAPAVALTAAFDADEPISDVEELDPVDGGAPIEN